MPRPRAADPLVLPSRIAAILAAQLFDFGTFTIMVGRHGIAAEVNPLVAHSFATFGMPMVALLKVVLVVLLASIIVILDRGSPGRSRVRTIGEIVTVLAVVAGLVGGISNTIAS